MNDILSSPRTNNALSIHSLLSAPIELPPIKDLNNQSMSPCIIPLSMC